jgi:hypothetical protein
MWFSIDQSEKMVDNLSPEEPKLKTLIQELINDEKLCLF